MHKSFKTIDVVSSVFQKAALKVLEQATLKKIGTSSTIQKIPKVRLTPDMGCFVQFSGDYNGLVVMNFSEAAAMEIYKRSMMAMGLPEEDLASNYTSSEVPDSIGEIVNQIMGQALSMVESRFDLSSSCGQPKALTLNSSILLTIESYFTDNRRITFAIEGHKFYMELSLEDTTFIPLKNIQQAADS